jgi:pimeloyl-ACP methyl ester carboxylesterase
MTTIPTEARSAPRPRTYDLEAASVTLLDRDRSQPILLLHGGAGPFSVAGFGDLLASRWNTRVIIPTHPGFVGTPRPDSLSSVGALARVYADLLDTMDLWDVTVIGNSIGGWIAAELALLGSPRVGGAVLVDAVGLDVPGHPVTDVSGLRPDELRALSFHDASRFPPNPNAPGPDLAALGAYTGGSMADPTLRRRLASLELPVHVVWGDSDGIATLPNGEAWAAAIPGATFTVIKDAGHMPQLEAPEQTLQAIGAHR